MKRASDVRPETLVAQALHGADAATGAIVPPIHLATTFARDEAYRLVGPTYGRDENPTFVHAERVLAALEGGAAALSFATGMAAATAVFRGACAPGDHVIAPRVGYFALRAWAARWGARWGVDVEPVDTTDLAAVRAALRPTTRLVWIETPANPLWDVTDLAAVAELAHGAGALVAVDSTCATPVHSRPIAHGADVVMHSATKYLGGHSDLLGGMLVAARVDSEAWTRIREIRHDEGATLGAFDAFLLLRGMRTLFARVERQSRTAQALAERLEQRGVHVRYPGLASHPQHAVAARQMQRGFGGMLSIQIGGDAARALAAIGKLRVWVAATSLGGVESLVEHRHTVEGPGTPAPPDLLRLSVGLEHEDDLFDDLVQAIA